MSHHDQPASDDRNLMPLYGRCLAPLLHPFPNFDLFFVKTLRHAAVQKRQLQPGDRVLDAGCGPGGSFPALVAAVTESGTVVGVEISPTLAQHAKRRVNANGWTNVQVVVADANQVKLEGKFDGLLMLGAPDVYASAAALSNLAPYLKDGARVVAFGAQLSRNRSKRVFNSLFRYLFSKMTFDSTPPLDYEPWKVLGNLVSNLTIENRFFGWMFLAWGSINIRRSTDKTS